MLSRLEVVIPPWHVHADRNTTLRPHLRHHLLPIQREVFAVLMILAGDDRVGRPHADLTSLFEPGGLRNGVAGFDIALSLGEA